SRSRARATGGGVRRGLRPGAPRPRPARADVWLRRSPPTRSAPATSAQDSGASRHSRSSSVGSVVPWAAPHVGAIATQSYANPRYGPDGLELLREGLSAEEVVERLTAADGDRAQRQLGVVDGEGRAATFTGDECHAGAGGDSRGRQSAALLVVERDAGYASLSDTLVDLRVDDHPDPLVELRRIHRLHDLLFGRTPRQDWIPVDDALRTELAARLARAGQPSLAAWAGVENLEERVEGDDAIDPVVLERLREAT